MQKIVLWLFVTIHGIVSPEICNRLKSMFFSSWFWKRCRGWWWLTKHWPLVYGDSISMWSQFLFNGFGKSSRRDVIGGRFHEKPCQVLALSIHDAFLPADHVSARKSQTQEVACRCIYSVKGLWQSVSLSLSDLPAVKLRCYFGLLLGFELVILKQSQNGTFCCWLGITTAVHLHVAHLQVLK